MIKEIVGGLKSLLTGMRITLGQFFKPTITVQYPHESLKMPKRFRGHIELVRDPETGKAAVRGLQVCARRPAPATASWSKASSGRVRRRSR